MLDVANLSFHYQPQLPILNNLSFSVPDGKIVGLLGKNGVGKTTTLKSLLGLLPIERGHITLDAISLTAQPLRYKERLNYVSDSHAIYNNLTGKEYLNFVADMYSVSSEARNQIYPPLVQAFQIEHYLPFPIKKLSHGTAQKIAIDPTLVNDPALWILDEPMTGLDVEAVQVLKALIRSRTARGKSVLFSSHILEICEKLCDIVLIMHHGTIAKTIALNEQPLADSLENLYLEVIANDPLAEDHAIKHRP